LEWAKLERTLDMNDGTVIDDERSMRHRE